MKLKLAFFILILLGLLGSLVGNASEVIYGVSPYYFAKGHNRLPLQEIRRRLPEIRDLGVTILWLQPVNLSADPGQGYDVIDHFKVNPSFGSEMDLKVLVQDAHRLGMRVILDVALNHLSIQHPFAQDFIKRGSASTYHNFFQTSIDSRQPYSEHANIRRDGKATFVYYFWKPLVNLNFSNPKVREYAITVLEHWVSRYDMDGFRLDASWGPQSRWPEFYSTVNSRLRKLKRNIYLIAEDKAAYPSRYQSLQYPHLLNTGFNAAYDWNSTDPNWVSMWSFQMGEEHGETVFNHESASEAAQFYLQAVKTGFLRGQVHTIRYLENNDTGSFLHSHSREQTKFAAAALFLLPGPLMMFYGQEMGISYPQWHLPSINPAAKLSSYDPDLWYFYKGLIQLKKTPLFSLGKLVYLNLSGPAAVEFHLAYGHDVAIVTVDMARKNVNIKKRPRTR